MKEPDLRFLEIHRTQVQEFLLNIKFKVNLREMEQHTNLLLLQAMVFCMIHGRASDMLSIVSLDQSLG